MREKYWWFTEESKSILENGYLKKDQTIQDKVDKVSRHAASFYPYRPELYEKFKEMFERGWCSMSSPIMANFGEERGYPISCFNSHIPDDLGDIYDTLSEVAMMTKRGGGTSGYFGDLRPAGSKVGDGGISSGVVSFYELFDKTTEVVTQGACYEEGTEVLTSNGFKDFRDVVLGKDTIAQLDEFNNVDFTPNYELTRRYYEGDLVKIRGCKREDLVNIAVTPNHRMVVERMKGSKRNNTKRWDGVTEIVIAEELKLHRDNRLYVSGVVSNKGSRLTDEERFKIAFQADGRKDYRSKTVRFRFSKKRKYERLLNIVEKLGLKYKLHFENSTQVYNVYVYGAEHLKEKDFSWVTLDNVSLEWCESFIEELQYWDGKKGSVNSVVYYSNNKQNIDVVQAISSISGKRSRIYENFKGEHKVVYSISISNNNKVGGDSCEIYRENYKGYVNCCIVPKGRIIVRKNNRTLVCGNTRRGAFGAYIDIDHPEVLEFIKTKDKDSTRQSTNTAVVVTDKWMNEMIEGDSEKRNIWANVLRNRREKGIPYILFKDAANNNKPQIYKDRDLEIKSSNVCLEVMLPSTTTESFVCCLMSLNLTMYDEWKDTDVVERCVYFLDAVMQEFIDKTENDKHLQRARDFSIRHRAIGIGTFGLHTLFQQKRLSFGEFKALSLDKQIHDQIQVQSYDASIKLGMEKGDAPIFDEALHHDVPRRNTCLMAIAP